MLRLVATAAQQGEYKKERYDHLLRRPLNPPSGSVAPAGDTSTSTGSMVHHTVVPSWCFFSLVGGGGKPMLVDAQIAMIVFILFKQAKKLEKIFVWLAVCALTAPYILITSTVALSV